MAKSGSSKIKKDIGIDLGMVLLAVFVGLVVCSLMNNNDIVEGNDAGVKDATVTPIKLDGGLCKGRLNKQDKICMADPSAKDEVTCGGSGDVTGGICRFDKFNNTTSYSGGLEGTVYDDWMIAVGLIDPVTLQAASTEAEKLMNDFSKTDIIDIKIKGRTKDGRIVDSKASGKDPMAQPSISYDINSNFLKYINVSEPTQVINNPAIPSSLQTEVYREVSECMEGWDQKGYKESYEYNGGRPIMGYSASEGLVCRNPLYYPVILQGSDPRIWLGQEGGDYKDKGLDLGGCPSPTAPNLGGCEKRKAKCGWESADGYASTFANTLYNNTPFTSSGECGLDSCAARYPQACPKANLTAAAKDGATYLINSIPDAPTLP